MEFLITVKIRIKKLNHKILEIIKKNMQNLRKKKSKVS